MFLESIYDILFIDVQIHWPLVACLYFSSLFKPKIRNYYDTISKPRKYYMYFYIYIILGETTFPCGILVGRLQSHSVVLMVLGWRAL